MERKVERKKRKDLHMAGFETYNLQIVGPALRPWLVTHAPRLNNRKIQKELDLKK